MIADHDWNNSHCVLTAIVNGDSSRRWFVSSSGGLKIDDTTWSSEFGAFQQLLNSISPGNAANDELIIDFSELVVIDPIPAMAIFTEAKNYCTRTGSRLTLNLGKRTAKNTARNRQREECLNLLAGHGFIDALASESFDAQIRFDNKLHSLRPGKALTETVLGSAAYSDSRCLLAKIIPISQLKLTNDSDSEVVEQWLNEIVQYGINAHFNDELELIEDFCHRTRVLLTEIVLNAREHAYRDFLPNEHAHFGIVGRIHNDDGDANQSFSSGIGAYTDGKRRTNRNAVNSANKSPGMSQFVTGQKKSFLEIFYVDNGRGLLADIRQWAICKNKEISAFITPIVQKPNSNTLHEIGKKLFRSPISRHNRDNRSSRTGLQHIGYILSTKAEDHVRTYTDGQWLGAMYPWPEDTSGGYKNLKKNDKKAIPAQGTAWHYILQLEKKSNWLEDPLFNGWKKIDGHEVEKQQSTEVEIENWQFLDERLPDSEITNFSTIRRYGKERCAWLPRAVTKQRVYQLIQSIRRHFEDGKSASMTWLIADISWEQANTILRVLLDEIIGLPENPVEIIMITTEWHIGCYRACGSRAELDEPLTIGTHGENAGELVELLKIRDSILFWKDIDLSRSLSLLSTPNEDYSKEHIESPFINEKVIWEREPADNKRIKVELDGYLDLTHALIDSKRRHIAMRALRRTWHLHADGADCEASDDLVATLLPREARLSLKLRAKQNDPPARKNISVGSVYVTGGTVDAHRRKENVSESIHLLRHSRHTHSSSSPHSSRFALRWTDANYTCRYPKEELPYERIRDTPYIGRGGIKPLSIRRFDRPIEDTDEAAFASSMYGQAPNEMYEHFKRLGILKIGHWSYSKHHDLITLNLRIAIDRDALQHGPITEWLIERLEVFKKEMGADFVIYPMHNTIGKIVETIQSYLHHADRPIKIPKHFIPVHFLSTHTQTAIRIPSTTYDRIRQLFGKEKKSLRRMRGEEVESREWMKEPLTAILLDDAAITGKVQYELEQLIRNAGATTVLHLGLVNRTGLPLYRQYTLDYYRKTNEYYWRWDVPRLGSARTCPLCHGIEQAKELSKIVFRQAAVKELQTWIATWQSRSVTTDWWRHGLVPANLPMPRPVTFGMEWFKNDLKKNPDAPPYRTRKYKIPHTTTTGLASTAIEIMRTTSYKAVGTKFISNPTGKYGTSKERSDGTWRRAKLELAITQTLLFFDDLNEKELLQRLSFLVSALIEPCAGESDLALERLACLILLLTTESQARLLLERILPDTSKHSQQLTEHANLAIGNLLLKASINPVYLKESLYSQPSSERDAIYSKLSIAYASVAERFPSNTSDAIINLIVLLGESKNSAHTGFFRKKLQRQIPTSHAEIRELLKLMEKFLREMEFKIGLDMSKELFVPSKHADNLAKIAEEPDDLLFSKADDAIFIESNCLTTNFTKEFFYSPKQIEDFIYQCLQRDFWTGIVGDIVDEATDRNDKSRANAYRKRWEYNDQKTPKPAIIHVDNQAPHDLIAVFPPFYRMMLREFISNVAHSSERFLYEGDEIDMLCSMSLAEDSTIHLRLFNRCTSSSTSQPKHSEMTISTHVLPNPVIRHDYEQSTNTFSVTIRIPLIAELARRTQ